MPIFFLHVTEGEEFTPDLEGVDRADACAAQKAAIDGVSELIAEAVKMGERNYKGRIDAQDEQGTVLFTLTFASLIHIELISPD